MTQALPNIVSASKFRLVSGTSSTSTTRIQSAADYRIPVEADTQYTMSASIGSNIGVSANFSLRINWYSRDASGNAVSISQSIVASFVGTAITYLVGQVISPSNASWAEFLVLKSASASASPIELNEPVFRRTIDNSLIAPGAVTDTIMDQTAPQAPGTPVLSTIAAVTEKDGALESRLGISFTAPATGRAPKKYFVEIWRAAAIGTSGSVAGYSPWRDFTTTVLTTRFRANGNYFHKARVTPLTSNDVLGTPSGFTADGVQPIGKATTIGRPQGPFFIHAIYGGVVLEWAPNTDADYAYTEITSSADGGVTWDFRDRVVGSEYQDNMLQTYADGLRYRGRNFDRGLVPSSYTDLTSGDIVAAKIAAADIADNEITVPYFAVNNSSQSLSAGVKTLIQDMVVPHGAGANLVQLLCAFRNASGGSRTVDVSIETSSGSVLAAYPSMFLADNQIAAGLEADHVMPSGSSTIYRMYVTAASPSIVIRTRLKPTVKRR